MNEVNMLSQSVINFADPQVEHLQPGAEKYDANDEGYVIERIEAQYEKTSASLVSGLRRMNDFREDIRKELTDLVLKAESIKDKCKKFDADEQNTLNGTKLLIKGERWYTRHLNVSSKEILDGLNEDIEVWNKNLKYLMNEKQQKIDKIHATLNNLLHEGITFFQTFKPAATKRLNVVESAKTMKKLDAFGQSDAPVDFQWPRKTDLETMPTDAPVRLQGFEMKTIDCGNYQGLAGLQLCFSNGVKTGAYFTQGTQPGGMVHVELDSSAPVDTIKSDVKGFVVKQIYFQARDGRELAKLFASKDNEGQVRQLADGEEIIGVYGHRGSYKCFRSIGFITWKPVYE